MPTSIFRQEYAVAEAFGNVAKQSFLKRTGSYLKSQGKQFVHLGPAVVASDLAFGVGGAALHDKYKKWRGDKKPQPTPQQLGYGMASGLQAKLGRGFGPIITRRTPKPNVLSHLPRAVGPQKYASLSWRQRFHNIPAKAKVGAAVLATGLGAGAVIKHKDEIESAGMPHSPAEAMQHPMVRAIMEEARVRAERAKERVESIIPGSPKTYKKYKMAGFKSGLKKAGLLMGTGVAADRFLVQPALNKAANRRVHAMQMQEQ